MERHPPSSPPSLPPPSSPLLRRGKRGTKGKKRRKVEEGGARGVYAGNRFVKLAFQHRKGAFVGALNGNFQAFGTIKLECSFWMFSPLGEKQVFKRHKLKYSQFEMLCFVVFEHQNPFHMMDVKVGQQSHCQFDKWHLFHAPTGICVRGGRAKRNFPLLPFPPSFLLFFSLYPPGLFWSS